MYINMPGGGIRSFLPALYFPGSPTSWISCIQRASVCKLYCYQFTTNCYPFATRSLLVSETYKTPGGGTKGIPGKPGVAPTPPQPPRPTKMKPIPSAGPAGPYVKPAPPSVKQKQKPK